MGSAALTCVSNRGPRISSRANNQGAIRNSMGPSARPEVTARAEGRRRLFRQEATAPGGNYNEGRPVPPAVRGTAGGVAEVSGVGIEPVEDVPW